MPGDTVGFKGSSPRENFEKIRMLKRQQNKLYISV
jgi:hypothetical protein